MYSIVIVWKTVKTFLWRVSLSLDKYVHTHCLMNNSHQNLLPDVQLFGRELLEREREREQDENYRDVQTRKQLMMCVVVPIVMYSTYVMLNVSKLIWTLCPGRTGNVKEQGAGQTLHAVLDVLKKPDQRFIIVSLLPPPLSVAFGRIT